MQSPWFNPQTIAWCQQLLNSYAYWTKNELVERNGTSLVQAQRLFDSEMVVVSHGVENDPVLNYGNQSALALWEMSWGQFTQTPSRLTAEPMNRKERSRMLTQAKNQGYISDYQGVRISNSGKRFRVSNAIIWTVRDSDGATVGQAAAFSNWQFLLD